MVPALSGVRGERKNSLFKNLSSNLHLFKIFLKRINIKIIFSQKKCEIKRGTENYLPLNKLLDLAALEKNVHHRLLSFGTSFNHVYFLIISFILHLSKCLEEFV